MTDTSSQVILDSLHRPLLFHWNGSILRTQLVQWLRSHNLEVPDDLVSFLAATGGGDLFETETILGPNGPSDLGDSLLGANLRLRSEGMPANFVAFHIGLVVSAVRLSHPRYVTLSSPGLGTLQSFSSFESWYSGTLRREYASRYGLPDLPILDPST